MNTILAIICLLFAISGEIIIFIQMGWQVALIIGIGAVAFFAASYKLTPNNDDFDNDEEFIEGEDDYNYFSGQQPPT